MGGFERGARHHLQCNLGVRFVRVRLELERGLHEQQDGQHEAEPAERQHPHAVIIEPRVKIAPAVRRIATHEAGDEAHQGEEAQAKKKPDPDRDRQLQYLERTSDQAPRQTSLLAGQYACNRCRNAQLFKGVERTDRADPGDRHEDEHDEQQRQDIEPAPARAFKPFALIPHLRPVERPVQDPHVAVHPFASAMLPLALGLHQVGGEHRGDEPRDGKTHERSDHDGQTEILEELAGNARHQTNGQKHRDDTHGGRDDGQPDFIGRIDACLVGGFAHAHVTHDVLDLDDGVVHQHPRHQSQREQ